MQLASSGVRLLKGAPSRLFPSSHAGGHHTSLNSTRSLHTPTFTPQSLHAPPTNIQALLSQARTAISRFAAHLTAPSTLRVPAHLATPVRALHRPATRMPSIQDRLSFPTRTFLFRPGAAAHLPRAPAVPRKLTDVGLGTARNFSSGRPIFQHLVENVPVSARALCEAELDTRGKKGSKARLAKGSAKKISSKGKCLRVSQGRTAALATELSELDHYFPAPPTPKVTTHLLIPLAPTPTARVPLSANPSALANSSHPLLPVEVIGSMLADHGTQTLRVSSLFARLDASKVFEEPGVHCEARGDPSGLCTVLEVRFEGWTESRVRGVLGEAGTGWCVLEEVWSGQAQREAEEMDAALDTLSECGSEPMMNAATIDPASSFVLPTLDFSASFAAPRWSPAPSYHPAISDFAVISTPVSDSGHNAWLDDDAFSDGGFSVGSLGSLDSAGWAEPSRRPPSTEDSWNLGFSSQFSAMMEGSDAPREAMF